MVKAPVRSKKRLLRLCAMVALGAATVLGSPHAHADARAELEKARASFLARNWADAEERLRVLLDPKSGLKERSIISQARMYLGASLLVQGKKDEAKEMFEKLVLDDPTFDPDPLSFPSEAINTFIDVRSSLLEQIKQATQTAARLAAERKAKEEAEREAQRVWLEKVKAQAQEEKITVRHSRLVATLPFGIGQFQNGQKLLGWIFFGTEAAAIAGTAITFGMYRYARDRQNEVSFANGNDPTGQADYASLAPQYQRRADEIRNVNLGFAAGFAVVAGIGIVQAHLVYVDETPEKKKRDLPPMGARPLPARSVSALAPIVSPLPGREGAATLAPGGMIFGVRGLLF